MKGYCNGILKNIKSELKLTLFNIFQYRNSDRHIDIDNKYVH